MITNRLFFGIEIVTFFRLCSRAPRTTMASGSRPFTREGVAPHPDDSKEALFFRLTAALLIPASASVTAETCAAGQNRARGPGDAHVTRLARLKLRKSDRRGTRETRGIFETRELEQTRRRRRDGIHLRDGH